MPGEPLYRQILGGPFDTLDDAVRRFHSLQGRHRLHGRCRVSGAEHRLGRLICAVLRLPRAACDAPFEFELQASPVLETWSRHFPGRTMRSRLDMTGQRRLRERLGPVSLQFCLTADDGRMHMHLERIHVFGLPWPRRWFPEVWAVERGDTDHFRFDVGARLRKLGVVVAYSGHLFLDRAGMRT